MRRRGSATGQGLCGERSDRDAELYVFKLNL